MLGSGKVLGIHIVANKDCAYSGGVHSKIACVTISSGSLHLGR